jgi:RHS repeat-associated protein
LILRDRDAVAGGDLGGDGNPNNGTTGLDERLYALQDANWNVTTLVTAAGAIAQRFLYDPYGTSHVLNDNFTDKTGGDGFEWGYRFTGQELDLVIGIHFYDSRLYAQHLGVFITHDIIPAANSYQYVNGSPLNYTDPSGMLPTGPMWDPYCAARAAGINPKLLPDPNAPMRGGVSYGWENDFRRNVWHATHPEIDNAAGLRAAASGVWPSPQDDARYDFVLQAYRNREALLRYMRFPELSKLWAASGIRRTYASERQEWSQAWYDTMQNHGAQTAVFAPGGSFDVGIIVAGAGAGVEVPPGRMGVEIPLTALGLPRTSPLGTMRGIPPEMLLRLPSGQLTRVPPGLLGLLPGGTTPCGCDASGALSDTLSRINSGVRFPHRNDGSVFQNREGLLPTKPSGYYTEYVLPTSGVTGPGGQRVVVGNGGEIYYTPNHYRTFIPVNP